MKMLQMMLAAMTIALTAVVVKSDVGDLRDVVESFTRPMNDGAMPSIDSATTWLNSAPLTTTALRGRVVLVEFWTYTCINWLRTEPYVRAWAEKYKDQGLVVIGVHSPEFPFEKSLDNVRWSIKAMNI